MTWNFLGYVDAGAMWRNRYEDDKLVEKVDKLWDEVKPLYDELHKYVRNQLLKIYGDKMDKDDEMIPAHLLSNMWVSQSAVVFENGRNFCSCFWIYLGAILGSSLRQNQAVQECLAGRCDSENGTAQL